MLIQQKISYWNSIINFHSFGKGEEVLIAFHGYGAAGYQFDILKEKLPLRYTLVAIDFPFHGSTEWKENRSFTLKDLLQIFEKIAEQLQLQPFGESKFSLISYSMGGRVALSIIQKMPEKVNKAILIAPDGLHVNFWYWLSTQTWLGNKWFYYTMHNPKPIFSLVKIGERTNIVNKGMVKLIHYYMDDKSERLNLYHRWTVMRNFKPHLQKIKSLVRKHLVSLRFLFGKHDPVILSKRSGVFEMENNVEIKIIDAGHRLMQPKYADDIISLLNKP